MTVTCAWTARDVVSVAGPDAASYLQGQISQDVLNLPVGQAASTFVLAPQGKVDGWGRVRRTADDAYEIDVDAGAGDAWVSRLSRFLLRTKAEITVRAAVRTLAVRGAVAPAEPADLADAALPLPGAAVGYDLLEPDEAAVAVVAADAVEVPASVQEADRIRAGIPAWGSELDGDTIPATVGQWVIDSSVSFTKGCYTGQELVARIDSRGGNVPRHLMGIVVDGPPPEPGTELRVAGAPAGTVTSSAAGPVGTGSVALAFVPRSIEVGTDGVDAELGGTKARIVSLPIG